MMIDIHQVDGPEIDEGSWAYLSAAPLTETPVEGLREQMIEACEASGWPTVSRSIDERVGRGSDPGHFFEGLRRAVAQADVFIALLGERSEISEAELALAYSHRRPVVGIRLSGSALPEAGSQSMLEEYERAHVVVCGSAEECASGLRKALADPDFAETIRQAR